MWRVAWNAQVLRLLSSRFAGRKTVLRMTSSAGADAMSWYLPELSRYLSSDLYSVLRPHARLDFLLIGIA